MGRFWRRRHDEPVDALLKANRPVPRDEFVATIVERIVPERRFHVLGRRRLVLAVGVTALAVGAAAAAGGVKSASNGVGSLVSVAKKTIVSPSSHGNSSSSPQGNQQGVNQQGTSNEQGENQQGEDNNQDQDDQGESSGDHQYAVTICHATHSATNPFVELTLSPQGAAQHLLHHPDDFILLSGSCP